MKYIYWSIVLLLVTIGVSACELTGAVVSEPTQSGVFKVLSNEYPGADLHINVIRYNPTGQCILVLSRGEGVTGGPISCPE